MGLCVWRGAPDGSLGQFTTPLQAFPGDEHAGVRWQIDWHQIMDQLRQHDDSSHFWAGRDEKQRERILRLRLRSASGGFSMLSYLSRMSAWT